MKIFARATVISVFASLVAGCAATASYIPPAPLSEHEKTYSAIVEKSYDDTWSALIQHAASTFFAIDNFEKESGLLTLSFGTGNPSAFIDCGHWDASWTDQQYQRHQFSGAYVDYLMVYMNGSFTGKMNLLVAERGPQQSEVTVNARYIVQAPPNTWSFDSGGTATVNVSNPSRNVSTPSRTCQPTYKAETTILDAVRNL